MSTLKEITDAEFDALVLKSDLPVFVDYWANWCSPCKQLTPIIEELAKHYDGKMTFFKMDSDANPEAPATYQVRGLPTLQVFQGGEMVWTSGARTKKQLMKALDEILGITPEAAQ